jgi:hypothetical protein
MLTGFDLVRAAIAVVDITAPEQSVLTVLAIMANEDAQCWPPINGPTGLTGKTKLSERAVQRAIMRLKYLGHIARRQLRHGCVYTVHPIADDITPATQTGDTLTGVTETGVTQAPTPATVAPKQPVTTKPLKASPPKAARASAALDPFPRPDWADAGHWIDFLANRKRKRLPNTASAYGKMLRQIEAFTDPEWPPGRILQHAAEEGWAGIYDPRGSERRNGQRNHHNGREDPIFAARRNLGRDN